jgi:hypothetical protein
VPVPSRVTATLLGGGAGIVAGLVCAAASEANRIPPGADSSPATAARPAPPANTERRDVIVGRSEAASFLPLDRIKIARKRAPAGWTRMLDSRMRRMNPAARGSLGAPR